MSPLSHHLRRHILPPPRSPRSRMRHCIPRREMRKFRDLRHWTPMTVHHRWILRSPLWSPPSRIRVSDVEDTRTRPPQSTRYCEQEPLPWATLLHWTESCNHSLSRYSTLRSNRMSESPRHTYWMTDIRRTIHHSLDRNMRVCARCLRRRSIPSHTKPRSCMKYLSHPTSPKIRIILFSYLAPSSNHHVLLLKIVTSKWCRNYIRTQPRDLDLLSHLRHTLSR